jgi:hypothetical protein
MEYVIYETGSCRGEKFRSKTKVTKATMQKFIDAIDKQEDIEDYVRGGNDIMPFDFCHLFENTLLPKPPKEFKKRFINLMKKIDKGLIVTSCWEEGTTGFAIKAKEKEMVNLTKLADYEWVEGEDTSNFDVKF